MVYEAVRETYLRAGLDLERHGTPDWNPLGDLIAPGETVLLKPNLVKDRIRATLMAGATSSPTGASCARSPTTSG